MAAGTLGRISIDVERHYEYGKKPRPETPPLVFPRRWPVIHRRLSAVFPFVPWPGLCDRVELSDRVSACLCGRCGRGHVSYHTSPLVASD